MKTYAALMGEVEPLDELSLDTLNSYAAKSRQKAIDWHDQGGQARHKEYKKKSLSTHMKNSGRATERIVKKTLASHGHSSIEDMVRSLSKKKLDGKGGYVKVDEATVAKPNELHISATKDNKYKVHAVGSKFAHGIKVGEHLTDTHLDDFADMGGKIKHVTQKKE